MTTIWKYTLEAVTEQTIQMPIGAKILTVQVKDGKPQLWALVNIQEKELAEPRTEPRKIAVYGTGQSIPVEYDKYIGTFQISVLVFHVFEILKLEGPTPPDFQGLHI